MTFKARDGDHCTSFLYSSVARTPESPDSSPQPTPKFPHCPLLPFLAYFIFELLQVGQAVSRDGGSSLLMHSLQKHLGICFLTQELLSVVLNSFVPWIPLLRARHAFLGCIYNPHLEKEHLDICFVHLSPQKAASFRKGH